MNFRFISVPIPAILLLWNAEMIRWPGFDVFGVIAIDELIVPAMSNAGFAGVTTVGSKSTFRSYEMIPKADTSWLTVIGIVTSPGVAVTIGSATGTPPNELSGPYTSDPPAFVTPVAAGALLLRNPRNSIAVSITPDELAPKATTLPNRSNAISAK